MQTYYNVFVRDWWRMERGQRVPYPGAPRKYLAKHVTYEDARELCAEYNSSHDPGPCSRKAEFEEA